LAAVEERGPGLVTLDLAKGALDELESSAVTFLLDPLLLRILERPGLVAAVA